MASSTRYQYAITLINTAILNSFTAVNFATLSDKTGTVTGLPVPCIKKSVNNKNAGPTATPTILLNGYRLRYLYQLHGLKYML